MNDCIHTGACKRYGWQATCWDIIEVDINECRYQVITFTLYYTSSIPLKTKLFTRLFMKYNSIDRLKNVLWVRYMVVSFLNEVYNNNIIENKKINNSNFVIFKVWHKISIWVQDYWCKISQKNIINAKRIVDRFF